MQWYRKRLRGRVLQDFRLVMAVTYTVKAPAYAGLIVIHIVRMWSDQSVVHGLVTSNHGLGSVGLAGLDWIGSRFFFHFGWVGLWPLQ